MPELRSSAEKCSIVRAAVRLAEWVGDDGVHVTPGGALRPANVPAAARALGIRTRTKVRRAADVPEVHRPWLAAVGMDLVTIEDGRAARTGRPGDPLKMWWAGLQAVLDAEVVDRFDTDPRVTALATMTVVSREKRSEGYRFQHQVEDAMHDRGDWKPWGFWGGPQRPGHPHPADGALAVLHAFDAVRGDEVTPLGVWAQAEWEHALPPVVTPQMAAKDLLAQLAGADDTGLWTRAERWFGDRTDGDAAAELVVAAADASPAERIAAVEVMTGLGDDALATFRAAKGDPMLAAHIRSVEHEYGLSPAPDRQDMVWLVTEYAHAALARDGAASARYTAVDALTNLGLDPATDGVDRIAGSGHPQAREIIEAIGDLAAPIPVQQLKISLTGSCWRRVLIGENVTLGILHRVITVLFGWDDDHLHVFTVGRREYADPCCDLETAEPEDSMLLHRALPKTGAKISYLYDLGACWQHEILLEKVVDDHSGAPECVAGRGDNPVEYYDPDVADGAEPFDAEAINKRLRRLTARSR